MLKILKTTPITLDGEDCLEVLIQDSLFSSQENCNACIYYDFDSCDCHLVHGCSLNPSARFIRLPFKSNLL